MTGGIALHCSQAAIDLIWREETGPDGYYQRSNECRADWPGGASGVTIGGFYDLGYVAHAELRRDWGDVLPAAMIDTLEGVVGIRGSPAGSRANWPASSACRSRRCRKVFVTREIPKWEGIVARLPNATRLSGDCFGARSCRLR